MKNRSVRSSAMGSMIVAAGLMWGSCSREAPPPEPSPPAGTRPESAAPGAPAAPPVASSPPVVSPPPASAGSSAPLATAQFSGDPDLRCDLLEVKRVSGGAVRAQWRLVNTGSKNIYYDFQWDDLYTIDPAENKKYGFLTDSEGKRILDVYWGTLKPGEQRLNWAKFPAPPPASTQIGVYVPKFAPFEDVPVAP